MAAEVFPWRPRIESPVSESFKTFDAQFGDGYGQSTGDGINNAQEAWNLTFIGKSEEIFEIRSFLRRHGGWKSFQWTTSFGDDYLFRAKGLQMSKVGANVYNLTVTFTQTFQP